MNRAMLEGDDNREAIAARLERVRDILGMSKREFAESLGMTEQGYGAYENCKRDLTLSAAKKLKKRHNLSLDFIYFGNKADLPHRIAKEL